MPEARIPERINVLAAHSTAGRPVFEELLVERLSSEGRYRLLKSPGLVLGLAAGDEFELDSAGNRHVTRRAGNVCIQVFGDDGLSEAETFLARDLEALSGRIDGRSSKEIVLTIPSASGFYAIEQLMKSLGSRFPGIEWHYGNVYDPSDGVTPLKWWA